jgi:hypothetical protein
MDFLYAIIVDNENLSPRQTSWKLRRTKSFGTRTSRAGRFDPNAELYRLYNVADFADASALTLWGAQILAASNQ